MYPSRDFRALLEQIHDQTPIMVEDQIIRSISREPFTEVLYYWDKTGRPANQLSIYQEGIQRAVSRDRYPIFLLIQVKPFPEFYASIKDGLEELWIKQRFSLLESYIRANPDLDKDENEDKDNLSSDILERAYSLMVGSHKGKDLELSPEQKLELLDYVFYQRSIPLIIDDQTIDAGVFLSRKTEQIYYMVTWLNQLISQ